VLIPREQLKTFGDAVIARLSSMKVGNPRNPDAKVGPVVNKVQQSSCWERLAKLKEECEVLFGGDKNFQPMDADAQKSAFVQPTLFSCKDGIHAKYVHDLEVFGSVATLVAYDGLEDLIAITRRGLGSLVASVFSDNAKFMRDTILGIGDLHGRVLAVNSAVGSQHTGHGNVVPSCWHGGPGRAGGGEELAGLRALFLYHRRFVVQGPADCLSELAAQTVESGPLYS
jgi:3,4-dehydroadipyl-CoA semialdehyde dehydrogenase